MNNGYKVYAKKIVEDLVLFCFYLSFEIKHFLDKGLSHLESSDGVQSVRNLNFSILRIVKKKCYTVYYSIDAFSIFA